jgi:hypothetical protein
MPSFAMDGRLPGTPEAVLNGFNLAERYQSASLDQNQSLQHPTKKVKCASQHQPSQSIESSKYSAVAYPAFVGQNIYSSFLENSKQDLRSQMRSGSSTLDL